MSRHRIARSRIGRSFRKSWNGGFRFSMVLFFATMFMMMVISNSPGAAFHPWGITTDGVQSPTLVVEPIAELRCTDTSC